MVPTSVGWTKHDSILYYENRKWKYAIIAAIVANKKIHLIRTSLGLNSNNKSN